MRANHLKRVTFLLKYGTRYSSPVFVGILTSPCDVFESHVTRAELQTRAGDGARSRLESVKQGKGISTLQCLKNSTPSSLKSSCHIQFVIEKGVCLL